MIPPPSCTGKGFLLSPLKKSHTELVHRWESDISEACLWTPQRGVYSENEFDHLLADRLENFYHELLIISKPDGEPAGMVYSYNENLLNGLVYLGTYLDPRYRKGVFGTKACIMFTHYLFSFFPFRKIIVNIFAFNQESLSCVLNAGFKKEGEFSDHVFFAGKYHTLFQLALFREVFYKRFGKIIGRFQPGGGNSSDDAI